jgi:hypothetical protein
MVGFLLRREGHPVLDTLETRQSQVLAFWAAQEVGTDAHKSGMLPAMM